MPLAPGTTIGRYRIESRIGGGAMGVVYLATDTRLERRVALKLIEPSLAADADFRNRFEREARAAAGLDHPHVLPVYEAGEDEEQLYLAMRYVPGVDLATQLARHGPLDLAATTRLVTQLAAALDAAHASGLIHRDVKPANVLLASGEHAYLADFGLARSAGTGITRPGQLVGTADYTAPELMRGAVASPASDVYALACLAVECLTGRPPFSRDGELATLYAHANDPIPELTDLLPQLPAGLQAVIERGLAKDASDRYESTGALAEALAEAGDGQTGERLTQSAEAEQRIASGPPARRSRKVGVALGVGILAIAGIAGAAMLAVNLPTFAPSATPSPSAPASLATSAQPSDAGGGGATSVEQPRLLPDGSYVNEQFDPAFSMQFGDGWFLHNSYVDAIGFVRVEDEEQAIDIVHIQVVWPSGCFIEGDGTSVETTLIGRTSDDVVRWIQSHPNLAVGDPYPVNVAGISGLTIDADVVRGAPACAGGDDPDGNYVYLFPVGGHSGEQMDVVSVSKGSKLRFIILEVRGRATTIIIRAPNSVFDSFAAKAGEVIDSFAFTGGP